MQSTKRAASHGCASSHGPSITTRVHHDRILRKTVFEQFYPLNAPQPMDGLMIDIEINLDSAAPPSGVIVEQINKFINDNAGKFPFNIKCITKCISPYIKPFIKVSMFNRQQFDFYFVEGNTPDVALIVAWPQHGVLAPLRGTWRDVSMLSRMHLSGDVCVCRDVRSNWAPNPLFANRDSVATKRPTLRSVVSRPVYDNYNDNYTDLTGNNKPSRKTLRETLRRILGAPSTKVSPQLGGKSKSSRKSRGRRWVATERKVIIKGRSRTVYTDAATGTVERIRKASTSSKDGKRTFKYVGIPKG